MKGDVRPGYKMTEVGVIPEDWEAKASHEFATVKTGPFGTLLKASEYSDGDGVPLISVGEIREGVLKITDHTPRVSETVTRRLPQYILQKGDIIFARKGGVERSALIRQPEEGWFLGSDGISLRLSRDCHDEYLALQFRSARVQGWLLQNAIGTTMPSLNQEILRNVVIPIPPTKAEQTAIATALSDVDALIESLEQLIAKKRNIKHGAMQELLTGKRRLPGFTGEWVERRIGDVARIQRGASPRPIDDPIWFEDNSSIGWVRISDVTRSGMYLFETTQKLSKEGVQKSRFVSSGNLLMSICATVGRPVVVMIDVCIHDGFVVFDELGVDIRLMYYVLKSIEDEWSRNGQTGSQMNLNTCLINNTKIMIPSSVPEQVAVANALTTMDDEIFTLESKLSKARHLKQAMMQELLTGRIRLV